MTAAEQDTGVPLDELTASGVVASIAAGRTSAREVVGASLRRIESVAGLKAFVSVRADGAAEDAGRLDRLPSGSHGPLNGVPLAVKDNIAVAGLPMTAGSAILAGHRPVTDAPAVRRLRDAGAIVVASANMHEFAWGGTSDNPYYGAVRNPWDPSRFAGGSSGGSAVAVAARCVPLALGTDTAGSVRFPAALTGVVGLRPTRGRVPADLTFPLAPSLDTVGPLTRTVADNALAFAVLAGVAAEQVRADAAGLRVLTVEGLWLEDVQPAVAAATQTALDVLTASGVVRGSARMPGLKDLTGVCGTILLAEAAAVHERWITERPEDYGADVRELLTAGAAVPVVEYVRAQRARRTLIADVLGLMGDADAIVTPTLPFTATPLGAEEVELAPGRTEPRASAMMRFCTLASVTGLPALSVPCGFDDDGLPIGLQLIGRPETETTLYRLGAVVERAVRAHERRPSR
ncbi:amidase [Spongiactinospora sp. 9N601]|uniref:amidase n=1 Tax=Spongiactinospora sp. 9N601 TaxID=3375149 RepID=UPI00378FBE33